MEFVLFGNQTRRTGLDDLIAGYRVALHGAFHRHVGSATGRATALRPIAGGIATAVAAVRRLNPLQGDHPRCDPRRVAEI